MEESLKSKVVAAIVEVVGNDAHVELEDFPPDKITGTVLSRSFETLSGVERQDRLWDALDRHLTRSERARVVFIVADTPEEYEAIRRAAG